MNYDVVALGEMLVDITANGLSEQGNLLYEANPGGAPCNVLAMLQKLGRSTAFVGKVGRDQFGKMLKQTIEQVGIETRGLIMDQDYNTTLAFVHTLPGGDRDFSFYRVQGADVMLRENEIKYDLIERAKVFHFGSLSMTSEPALSATKKALEIAKAKNKIISFDPNLREPLWESLEKAKAVIEFGLKQCDILKVSDNEIQFITGFKDYNQGLGFLQEQFKIPVIFLTMGKDGSRVCYRDQIIEAQGYRVDTIESTGAGDAFMGCVIDGVLTYGMDNLSVENLGAIIDFANAAAALVTTRKGAILSMPERTDVEKLRKSLIQ